MQTDSARIWHRIFFIPAFSNFIASRHPLQYDNQFFGPPYGLIDNRNSS